MVGGRVVGGGVQGMFDELMNSQRCTRATPVVTHPARFADASRHSSLTHAVAHVLLTTAACPLLLPSAAACFCCCCCCCCCCCPYSYDAARSRLCRHRPPAEVARQEGLMQAEWGWLRRVRMAATAAASSCSKQVRTGWAHAFAGHQSLLSIITASCTVSF
jgi:hypothetical protein